MKSFVKSAAFYKEAEDMQTGWGRYLKSIDQLKDAVYSLSDISLNDACWVLYGEGYCSSTWESFRCVCKDKGLGRRKMPWPCWKGLFDHLRNEL